MTDADVVIDRHDPVDAARGQLLSSFRDPQPRASDGRSHTVSVTGG